MWFLGQGEGDGSLSASFLYLGFLFGRGSWRGVFESVVLEPGRLGSNPGTATS